MSPPKVRNLRRGRLTARNTRLIVGTLDGTPLDDPGRLWRPSNAVQEQMNRTSSGRAHVSIASAALLAMLAIGASGCSVVMAAKQPTKKDVGC